MRSQTFAHCELSLPKTKKTIDPYPKSYLVGISYRSFHNFFISLIWHTCLACFLLTFIKKNLVPHHSKTRSIRLWVRHLTLLSFFRYALYDHALCPNYFCSWTHELLFILSRKQRTTFLSSIHFIMNNPISIQSWLSHKNGDKQSQKFSEDVRKMSF